MMHSRLFFRFFCAQLVVSPFLFPCSDLAAAWQQSIAKQVEKVQQKANRLEAANPKFVATSISQSTLSNRDLGSAESAGQAALSADARDGLDLILNRSFFSTDFDQETFDQLWRDWPQALREKAEKVGAAERRRMAFERYGLTARKDDPSKPIQFVVDGLEHPEVNSWNQRRWALNCFACHGGNLYDSKSALPGLPNNRINLETLYDDLAKTKKRLKKPLSDMDICNSIMPMGTTVGTSNAVVFGVALMSLRDNDMDIRSFPIPEKLVHHDLDAPPWWNYSFKKMLYIDGFTQKHHRALMPFILVKHNDGPKFRALESEFEKIQQFVNSVESPRYSGRIDSKLALSGRDIFRKNCAGCHGTYEPEIKYPELTVPIAEIETDPVRLSALSKRYRNRYGVSWLGDYGKAITLDEPEGYVAPPLKGIWATAPYFHNGSVPTLRAVLDPNSRPAIWARTDPGFDPTDVGLKFKAFDVIPEGLTASQKHEYFDTNRYGKSNRGHDFGAGLTSKQQDAVLEFLKTL